MTRTELQQEATFDSAQPRFFYSGSRSSSGFYHFDWREAEKANETFYRQQHPLASHLIEVATNRKLPPATLCFNYHKHGGVISALEPFLGQSGWIELSKLSITSLDTEEFLILAGATDHGDVFDGELCRKLLSISATVTDSPTEIIPDFSDQRNTEMTKRVNEVEQRNMKHFDEEVLKLDHWSDDLKQGLEREIKELDRQIREARKVASLAASLNDKLEAQKLIRSLESTRKDQRKRLFDAQDEIDSRRDELIASIEVQLDQKKTISHVFTIRWRLGA